MVKKSILLLCLVIILLAGCSVKPQRVIVKETEYIYIPITDDFLKECPVTKPPNKKEYLAADDIEKESMLRTVIGSLYGDLNNCNKQIKSIGKFNHESKKLLEKKTKK